MNSTNMSTAKLPAPLLLRYKYQMAGFKSVSTVSMQDCDIEASDPQRGSNLPRIVAMNFVYLM